MSGVSRRARLLAADKRGRHGDRDLRHRPALASIAPDRGRHRAEADPPPGLGAARRPPRRRRPSPLRMATSSPSSRPPPERASGTSRSASTRSSSRTPSRSSPARPGATASSSCSPPNPLGPCRRAHREPTLREPRRPRRRRRRAVPRPKPQPRPRSRTGGLPLVAGSGVPDLIRGHGRPRASKIEVADDDGGMTGNVWIEALAGCAKAVLSIRPADASRPRVSSHSATSRPSQLARCRA